MKHDAGEILGKAYTMPDGSVVDTLPDLSDSDWPTEPTQAAPAKQEKSRERTEPG